MTREREREEEKDGEGVKKKFNNNHHHHHPLGHTLNSCNLYLHSYNSTTQQLPKPNIFIGLAFSLNNKFKTACIGS